MPAWLIQFLISLAFKFGLAWLFKKFPWLPQDVKKVVEDTVQKLADNRDEKKEIVREGKARVKRACSGVGCAPDLVG